MVVLGRWLVPNRPVPRLIHLENYRCKPTTTYERAIRINAGISAQEHYVACRHFIVSSLTNLPTKTETRYNLYFL